MALYCKLMHSRHPSFALWELSAVVVVPGVGAVGCLHCSCALRHDILPKVDKKHAHLVRQLLGNSIVDTQLD